MLSKYSRSTKIFLIVVPILLVISGYFFFFTSLSENSGQINNSIANNVEDPENELINIDPSQTFTPTNAPTEKNTALPSITPTETSTPILTNTPRPTATKPNPTVSLSISVDSDSIDEPGGMIIITINIKNDLGKDYSIQSLTDSSLGDLNTIGTCNTLITIPANSNYTCSYENTFFGNAGSSFTRNVTALLEDGDANQITRTDEMVVHINDMLPSVLVSAIPSISSLNEPGGMVTYTVEIQNTSVEEVTLLQLVDDKSGDLNGQGTCATGGPIAQGSTYSCSFDTIITGTAGVSSITVSAQVQDDETNAISNSVSASVEIADVLPSVLVSVNPSILSLNEPGGFVTYTVEIQNTSVEEVTLMQLVDDISGDLNGQGTCATGGTIAAGSSFYCSYSNTVNGNAGETSTDTVTGQVQDDEANAASNSSSASVEITDVLPSVSVSVKAIPSVLNEPGGHVTYSVSIFNTSVESVILSSLVDDVYGDLSLKGCVAGAIPAGGLYNCSYTESVNKFAGDTITNSVTAHVQDDEANPASDSSTATVSIEDSFPIIIISVTPGIPTILEPGGTVIYVLDIENLSGEAITITQLVDDLNGDLIAQGTCPETVVAIGATYTCTYSGTVEGNAGDTITNTVAAQAKDAQDNTVDQTASGSVSIVG